MITKEEWVDWKHDPVTEAFYEACEQRILDTQILLGATAGIDSVNDNHNRGFIAAYQEMLEFEVEE